jgi:hypothetical protein
MPDGIETARVFDGYNLGVWVGNSYSQNEDEPSFVRIWQEYRPPESDTVRTDSLREIKISLLCVKFDCLPMSYCPGTDSITVIREFHWSDSTLAGSYYYFGAVFIPKKCKTLDVSFVATLADRETGRELERQPVKVTLYRKTGTY